MENIIKALNTMKEINKQYGISNELIEESLAEISVAKVCTPIIGKFSTGKSALVNTLLGCNNKILKEDITPETAIPAEIVYSELEEYVSIYNNNGEITRVEIPEYRNMEMDANTVKCVRIHLRNESFLSEIPDVMLVDMPGFESGYEIHNKAIDNYLSQSLAYMVAFPADDMIVRSSVGNILKELCLHNMPICVVITKYDKGNDEFDDTLEAMKDSIRRYVGDRSITYCCTSSFTGDAEEVKKFLQEIQDKSQDILSNKFRDVTLSILNTTESYLNTVLKNSEMTEPELQIEEERIDKQLSELKNGFNKEKEAFESQLGDCIDEMVADIQNVLEENESILVATAMNKQDINEQINIIIRNAITISVKKRFIPRVEKYLRKVKNCINEDSIGNVHIYCNFNTEEIDKGITSSVVSIVAGLIVGLPVLGVVIAAGLAIANKIEGNKKREEKKSEIRMKLHSEVYPQVVKEVRKGIEAAVRNQFKLINTSIEEDIQVQTNTLEQAIKDVRKRKDDENEKKAKLAIDINSNLERIGEMKNGIR